MSDYTREDIDLMALAAGYDLEWDDDTGGMICPYDDGGSDNWEPGSNYADTFRLMVDADLSVGSDGRNEIGAGCFPDDDITVTHIDDHPSKCQAYMHAICRAAIEKGRAMREGE